jgi:hypothetical protein
MDGIMCRNRADVKVAMGVTETINLFAHQKKEIFTQEGF